MSTSRQRRSARRAQARFGKAPWRLVPPPPMTFWQWMKSSGSWGGLGPFILVVLMFSFIGIKTVLQGMV